LFWKKKNIKNPIEIIFSACSFMQYWTGLQSLDTQKAIDEGVNLMLKTAFKLLGKQAKTVHGPLLPGGSDGADGGGINKTPGGQWDVDDDDCPLAAVQFCFGCWNVDLLLS
jgi:hypothetical protein